MGEASMIFTETKLHGAFVIDPEPFSDERGLFMRTYCKKEFEKAGISTEFVQFNQSVNKMKGTLRGMHYQYPPHAEVKLIRCIQGAVFDVIVDLRRFSPTFLQWFGIELSSDNLKMLSVPPGIAHGFQTLEDNSQLLYHHSSYYTPSAEAGLNYNDSRIGIRWPLPVLMISEKDKNYASLDLTYNGITL